MGRKPLRPKSGLARTAEGDAHPVLARLPDLSRDADDSNSDQSERAAAAGFVDYRFDMPAGSESQGGVRYQRRHAARFPSRSSDVATRARSSFRTRPIGSPARVQPDSDPFAIPRQNMLEKLAPAAHFLVLFVIFTAAGTFFISGRQSTSSSKTITPQHAVEPFAPQLPEPSVEPAHPKSVLPSAKGPHGAAMQSPNTMEASHTAHAVPPAPALSPLPAASDALPQVQTSEPTAENTDLATAEAAPQLGTGEMQPPIRLPAVARFEGHLIEAPRHAYHDNNQPGLH